ncbi:MAG TPA: site-specific integrase [Pseudonocardiaceae bacterium]|nr:site-specific integrase [Pseudonocardiaceae bacterium]
MGRERGHPAACGQRIVGPPEPWPPCSKICTSRLGSTWADTGLVFTTRTGRPIEPRNLVRSFVRIRDSHGIRKIRVHAIRHTTASLLKDLGVPARNTQIILGHAHISTTQQIYTHVDEAARREALTRLNKLLGGAE